MHAFAPQRLIERSEFQGTDFPLFLSIFLFFSFTRGEREERARGFTALLASSSAKIMSRSENRETVPLRDAHASGGARRALIYL